MDTTNYSAAALSEPRRTCLYLQNGYRRGEVLYSVPGFPLGLFTASTACILNADRWLKHIKNDWNDHVV